MSRPTFEPIVPTTQDAHLAKEASRLFEKGHLNATDLPKFLVQMIAEILSQTAKGRVLTVVPVEADMTTTEAAEFLNVSRPYLVRLLECGKIPYRLVGTHKRIYYRDINTYKQQQDERSYEALAELSGQAQELKYGLLITPMHQPVVIYDACVLYPAPLRDILMSVAVEGLCRAHWTEDIHEEWIGNLLMNRPDLTRERLDRARLNMNQAIPDALVTGYEKLIPGLNLPDTNDRHVLAAAIHAKAKFIITHNAKDFPAFTLAPSNIEISSPDVFLSELLDDDPHVFVAAVGKQRARLKNPPLEISTFLETLLRQGLNSLVSKLQTYRELL